MDGLTDQWSRMHRRGRASGNWPCTHRMATSHASRRDPSARPGRHPRPGECPLVLRGGPTRSGAVTALDCAGPGSVVGAAISTGICSTGHRTPQVSHRRSRRTALSWTRWSEAMARLGRDYARAAAIATLIMRDLAWRLLRAATNDFRAQPLRVEAEPPDLDGQGLDRHRAYARSIGRNCARSAR